MNLIAGVRWLFARASRRAASRRRDREPADMGTAFGLDAITTLEAELDDERSPRPAPEISRFERRLRRRNTL